MFILSFTIGLKSNILYMTRSILIWIDFFNTWWIILHDWNEIRQHSLKATIDLFIGLKNNLQGLKEEKKKIYLKVFSSEASWNFMSMTNITKK